MNDLRFANDAVLPADQVSSGFLLVSVAGNGNDQTSGLQQFYQLMYQQAVQATEQSGLPDLFANMN